MKENNGRVETYSGANNNKNILLKILDIFENAWYYYTKVQMYI